MVIVHDCCVERSLCRPSLALKVCRSSTVMSGESGARQSRTDGTEICGGRVSATCAGAVGVPGMSTATFRSAPLRPAHQLPIAAPALLKAPETDPTSPGAPCPTPSPIVVIMRVPDSVSCDNGPVCASEKGRYSRTLASTSSTALIGADAMLLMPSTKVFSSFAPDS